ncbi:MAG: glycoside hydrolase family 5 protein [Sphingomonas sp.]
MTLIPSIYGTFQPHKTHLPRWIMRRETPILTSEGDEVILSLFVNNYQVGSEILVWFTGGNSLASGGNWERTWHDVMTQELARYGCSYRRLSSGTTPAAQGTLSGIITIGAGYQGQLMRFANRSRRNQRTNATNPDGTPGYREMQFLLANQGAAGTPERNRNGTGQILGGNLVRVLDTSRTPTGTPRLALRLPGGQASLYAGDTLRVRVEVENIRAGTKLKMYPAEDGRKALNPSFRPELRRAGEAAGHSVFLPRYDPKNPVGYYDGGEITFADDTPVEMVFDIQEIPGDQVTRELHFISILTAEGDALEFDYEVRARGDWAAGTAYRRGDWVTYLADGGRYIYTDETTSNTGLPTDQTKWRPYVTTQTSSLALSFTVRPNPPRYWELRATVAAGAITYAIHAPLKAAGDSVALVSTGAPAGFDAALAAALGEAMTHVGGRLVAAAGGEITFTVPLTGSGKHALRISDAQGNSPIVISDACVYLTPPIVVPVPAKQFGINLAGAEFTPAQIPGTLGTHYVYPGSAEMDYYWQKGIRIFRLPVKWERIQPALFGPLGGGNDDIARVDAVIAYWEGLGGTVILDVHNYMSRKDAGKVAYDNPAAPTAALVDLWERLAARYAGRAVWFDLMNEPSGDRQSASRVADVMQNVVNAIRGRTDATNMILVEGQRYSSAQYWVPLGQGAAFDRFYDPAGNFAFSPHSYVDADASGTSGLCVIGAPRLTAITSWADERGFKLWLGEIAGGDPAKADQGSCGPIMAQVYDFIRDNPAWLGVSVWGGGRFWGRDYPFRLDPLTYAPGNVTGQLAMLLPYLAAA